jgi:predicted nucleotidyltransferase
VPTVDIIVRPAVPFERMVRNRIEKDLGGVRLSLASIDDLISLKTGTGRKQDASDVEALKIARRVAGEGK